jgi:hypothetical protein
MTNTTCGCCEGTRRWTPLNTANRPGLPALAYRVGTHAAFLETMKARLSSLYIDLPRDEPDANGHLLDRIFPLRGLTTRASDDPAIALLDSWAVVGAVLTFYQERVANEGYLRTATERRSILELARLIDYRLRPGVSASVFLAYTLDDNATEPVEIPAGAKAQSVPDPGEDAQTFETSEPLEARREWNNLKPRPARPQTQTSIRADNQLYLKGISTNLKVNDPLLIDFGDGGTPQLFRVMKVEADTKLDRTVVTLADWLSAATMMARANYRAQVLALVQRLQDTSALKRTAKAEMVSRVVGYLQELEKLAQTSISDADLAEFIHDKTVPRIGEELAVASSDVKYAKIENWLTPLVKELNAVAANRLAAASISTSSAGATSGTLSHAAAFSTGEVIKPVSEFDPVAGVLKQLTLPPTVPPRNTLNLARDLKTAFAAKADIGPQIITSLQPALSKTLSTALSRSQATADNRVHVYALRLKAGLFGHNVPPLPIYQNNEDGTVTISGYESPLNLNTAWRTLITQLDPLPIVALDAEYEKVQAGGWAVIDYPLVGGGEIQTFQRKLSVHSISATQAVTMNVKATTARVTQLAVDPDWLADVTEGQRRNMFSSPEVLSRTTVYTQSEELELIDRPIEDDVCKSASDWLELDGWYPDLKSGRWLIVSGERTDVTVPDPNDPAKAVPVSGIVASELVMLAEVIQDIATEDGRPASSLSGKEDQSALLPAEKTHTFIKFATDLEYCYQRQSVTIYGNVVKATHGETRKEVMGSGDGSRALQSFALRQPPLTYVAAPNPSGVDSTLKVFVNEVQWRESASLAPLGPTDRKFITRTDDVGTTTVIFGNGERGARLPTGRENVRAEYRSGIGQGGNVKADQISLLLTRPLGVKSVINPLRASGGADKESRDQARQNAPLAVMALDRLVSVQDYADFARTFAGIGKAAATSLAVGQREIVHVTIAGADDIPIDPTSDLYRNLITAMRQYGDPYQPFQVDLRELQLLVISANVRILPDYVWENVATQLRAGLLEYFSFDRRDLGQDVTLSEVISVMHRVRGVAYVDVDLLATIPEKKADGGVRRLLTPDEITQAINDLLQAREQEQQLPDVKKTQPPTRLRVDLAGVEDGTVRPAQLALLSPKVPDALILNRL